MQNDKTTLKDLSIFTSDTGGGIFGLLDHTVTQAGKEMLRKHLYQPPANFESLQQMQDVIKFLSKNDHLWTDKISNGTLVMLEKFFESADNVSRPPIGFELIIGKYLQKFLNKNEYFFTQFSLSHISDFIKGCTALTDILISEEVPVMLRGELEAMQRELSHRLTGDLLKVDKKMPFKELATLSFNVRREMKSLVYRLIYHYARLDAWRSMALATLRQGWMFPVLMPSFPLHFEAEGLYHPLLEKPVAYNALFDKGRNFLILTGANMSGKTTFMRALGVSALMAHLGMGVPAKNMSLSFLQEVITNMHVEDDLLRGESYFYAEVQRMKHTAEKLQQASPNLVLMDELFKGTNVHDAYECTKAVVEGLLQRPQHIMVLSTHLYEVAQHFSDSPHLLFAYFITQMREDGGYQFNYELKEGVSNDRIGYRILQKAGVLELLKPKH